MRRFTSVVLLVAFVGCFLLPLAGCGFFDMLTGVVQNPVTGLPEAPPPGTPTPLSGAGNILGLWIPWAGTVLGALGTAYQQFRVKKYGNAATSVIAGVEKAFDTDNDGVISVEELKAALKIAQKKAGTQTLVQVLLDHVKNRLP